MRRWFVGLAPRRRVVVVAAVVIALLGTTGIVIADRRADPTPVPAVFTHRFGDRRGHQPPVILVPGYGGGQSALDGLSAYLRQHRRFATVFRLPGDGKGDLTLQARALQKYVAGIVRFAGRVDVVGYSAGGVVVRLWVADDGGSTEARHIVTLGTPFHGADLAGVGQALAPGACPVACRQLVPGSPLLTQLATKPIPSGIAWMSVWTNDDTTVDPPDSARLDGATNVAVQDICPDLEVSHGELPTDPLVSALVLEAIAPGPIETPSRSECTIFRGPINFGRPSS